MAITKKNNTVATPIDERETFVSLKKTFAETEQDAQDKLRTLYALQQADNAIEKLMLRRGELPQEVAALENEVESLKSKCAHIEELIAGYNASIDAAREQIVELDADIEKYRKQLENITNSREYDSINKELENQGLLRAIAEKNINEARYAIEDRKADLERLSDRISIREEDLLAKQEELSQIVDATAAEEQELLARKAECAGKIDERTLSAYERIRKSVHNHLAVVTVYNEDSCGGCFNTITPQRRIEVASGKKLVICEHCGRIIVNPDL